MLIVMSMEKTQMSNDSSGKIQQAYMLMQKHVEWLGMSVFPQRRNGRMIHTKSRSHTNMLIDVKKLLTQSGVSL